MDDFHRHRIPIWGVPDDIAKIHARETKLEEHARLEEREPVSRFPFKSPCWASWEIDFAVHVVLARMVEEKYPEMAERLRNTSPRWGWRARGRPLTEADLEVS